MVKFRIMKKILVILLVAFVIIQFFPIDKNNPEPTPQLDFLNIKNTPDHIKTLVRNGCYDCHSNETKYVWYSKVQPIGWFLKKHIDEGRKHLNFSTFATYEPKRQAHKLFEVGEMIEQKEMPLDSYVVGHPEANLTDTERQEMVQYFKIIEDDIRREYQLPAEEKKK